MKKSIQLSLLKADLRFFGGSLSKGKRKSLRPLSTKEPIHLVVRSVWAKGRYSFLKPHNKKVIQNLIGAMGPMKTPRINKKIQKASGSIGRSQEYSIGEKTLKDVVDI